MRHSHWHRALRRLTRSSLVAATAILASAALFQAGCGTSSESKTTTEEDVAAEARRAEKAAESAEVPPEFQQAGVTALDLKGPHDPPVDVFNPDERDINPALGGRVIQHIASEPPNLNFAIENSAVIHWIWREIHAGVLEFNLSTWEYDPVLARSYEREDMLILNAGAGTPPAKTLEIDGEKKGIVFGQVREDGENYIVASGSSFNEMAETTVPKSDVASLEQGTVFTFRLRDDVLWHDGHEYDADDMLFSLEIYRNPNVDCDEKRFTYESIVLGEKLESHAARFFYKEQFFQALQNFALEFAQLPSHLYNLHDPDNADYDPNASLEKMGEYINENPHNIDWVGLGPYKLTTWERGQYLEAEKFDDYFEKDPRKTGYMDKLRWRYISDDNLAFQALLNGEVDIFDRVKSEDFMGAATRSETFTSNFYKAFTYVGNLGYTSWNMYNEKLSDVRVRQALAHAFDVRDWIRTNYQGLALTATGSMFRFGPGYNRDVKVVEYNVETAQELLAEAGWYDRDGNGIIDKDGVDFTLECLMPSGNKASEKFLQKLQESYEKIGVKVEIRQFEWATFLERILERDFESCNLAWVLNDVESDPFALWHSSEAAPDRRTSNHAGYRDEITDDLIERGRREIDPEKRHEIWRELHARVYSLHPYLFGWNVPRKIAFNKDLRGVKLYKFAPGYMLRDMYYEEGTPGTRPLEGGV